MNALDYWQLFLETGAPEMYLMYCKRKSEETHVFVVCLRIVYARARKKQLRNS